MVINWHAFFQVKILGNTLESYCWFVGIILLGIIFKRLLSRLLSGLIYRLIKKLVKGVRAPEFHALLVKPISVFVLLLAFYLAFDRLEFPAHWNLVPAEKFGLRMVIFRSFQVAIITSLTWVLLRIMDFFALVILQRAIQAGRTEDHVVPFIKDIAKIILCSISLFFMLGAVFHVDVRALITGLGIGGLALALAVKDSLENLLSSVTIFFDKPFQSGDLVKVGNIQGHVEKIGFRSTRIRTLDKSTVTVPNKKMVDAELDNLAQRTVRRAKFKVVLNYKTTPEQVKNIITGIKKAIVHFDLVDKNRVDVHFLDFALNGLEVNITYVVNSTEDDVYNDIRENINMQIMNVVYAEGVMFATS